MMTDPIADMLTRIRNANAIERPVVDMRATRVKTAVAQVLKEEGFVYEVQLGEMATDEHGHPEFKPQDGTAIGPKTVLRIYLKYGPEGERVIRHIQRYSKPGCRVYKGHGDLRPVLDGLGISVISTNKGVMSDRRARAERVGGEVLCTVW